MRDRPFSKVLVANRGEIAVRVIRAAKELGMRVATIYSSADSKSLHVLMADEAYMVGGPEPRDSYLNMERIVSIAKKCGAEAVHPGYGFLSQVPEFAKMVSEEGIEFVGPPESVQRVTGDKLGAKRLLGSVGVPVIPGTLDPVSSVDEAVEAADKVGYPVMLKPVLGGGGIGMRICWSEEELVKAVESAMSLASSAFGRAELYVERYFPKAKHIEVQILADKHGNVVHLFERECSIQRRFQKLLEEAPSPSISEEERERVTELAIKVARAVKYVNAGTVEFLYVPDTGDFYFLEVNSRIQVEHPVTEMVTGVDIVEEQFWIAAGEELRVSQSEVELRGHSIEVRINAEDPYNNFSPSPGLVTRYLPPGGFGIRVESGIYEGYEVLPYYDPLIVKLIAWGESREKAIARLGRALDEFVIEGIRTNIPLHKLILSDERFLDATYTTKFIEERRVVERLARFSHEPLRLPRAEAEAKARVIAYVPQVSAWKVSGRLYGETPIFRAGGVRRWSLRKAKG